MTANNYVAKDGNGNLTTFRSVYDGTGQIVMQNLADTSGVPYSNTYPQPFLQLQTTIQVSVVPTVTASTYAASKVIGGIMTFSSVLSSSSPYASILESITLTFKASVQTVTFYVAIFTTSPSGTFTDTNTAAIASGDTAYLLGIYQLSIPNSELGTHTIYNLDAIGKGINGSSQNLYAVVVPGATTASLASTSDMAVTLTVLQG